MSDDAVAAEFSRILGAMIDRNFALEVGRDAALARVAELRETVQMHANELVAMRDRVRALAVAAARVLECTSDPSDALAALSTALVELKEPGACCNEVEW